MTEKREPRPVIIVGGGTSLADAMARVLASQSGAGAMVVLPAPAADRSSVPFNVKRLGKRT